VPFEADTYGALVLEIATGTPKALNSLVPALPDELSRIVLRAMSRDVNERYASMEGLIAALEPFTSVKRGSQEFDATQMAASSGGQPKVNESQATPPTTKPHLAATPFASELTGRESKRSSLVGLASFTAAAAAIVTGIWFFTREANTVAAPSGDQPLHQENQLKPDPNAATHHAQRPESPLDERRDLAPPSTLPTGQTPAEHHGQQAQQAQRAHNQTGNWPNEPDEANTQPPVPVEPARGSGDDAATRATRGKRAVRETPAPKTRPGRKHDEPTEETTGAVQKTQTRSEPNAAPSTTHRARSGSLNVNEF
jgi:serine/threonine-protein kinase